MWSMHKAFLLHFEVELIPLGKRFEVTELWAGISSFSHEKTFLLEGTMDKLWLFRLGILQDIFLKMNGVCRFKENSWQYWVPMIKFKFFQMKIKIVGNLMHYYDLDSFPILKDFSAETGCAIHKCDFWILYNMTCVSIWKGCITQWSSLFFKWPMHAVTKSCMSKRHIQSIT